MSAQQELPDALPHGTIRIYDRSDDEHPLLLHPPPTQSPADPLNWSLTRKYWSASIILFITAFTAATSNNFGSAGTALVDTYGISWGVQNTAAGVLFLAIGYGTLLLSSAPWLYGRRSSYLICLVWSIIGTIWFAKINSSGDAIGSQLFVGGSEAVAEATVQLSLFDLFFQHQRGLVMGFYVLAISVGTFLGPLIGGYIADSNLGWTWVGWFGAIITGVTLIVTYFGLEETAFERNTVHTGMNPDLVASSRHQSPEIANEKYEEPTKPADVQVAPAQHNEADMARLPGAKTYWQRIALVTPASNMVGLGLKQYVMRTWNNIRIFWFPAVLFAGVQWGFQDAWLSFYLTVEDDNWTSPPYNYGDAADAIMNVPTLIGAVIGCIYGGYFSDLFVNYMARKNHGVSEAEHRLWLMIAPSILCPVGLVMFGVGTQLVYPWPVAYVGLGFIGFGWGCAGDLALSYTLDVYPEAILESMVGVSVINNSLACIFTFVCSIWLDVHSASEVFVTIAIISFVSMLGGTILMLVYGKRMRMYTTPSYERFLQARGQC